MADWSPTAYLKFADERSRPARDLLAQVSLTAPQLIYDLGCGPGNSTLLLDSAFAQAEIIGVDNSAAMLATAREVLPHREFIDADLATWMPDADADLLFSNATFQWVPDHAAVLRRMLETLKPGAMLAIQMPDNLNEPSHSLMRSVAKNGPWADKMANAADARSKLMDPQAYYELLKPLCTRVDIWHSIYNHPLDGVQGIIDLVSSTGLRPFLDLLTGEEKPAFIAAYKARLAEHYAPARDGKVLLRFPRLFIVAVV